VVDLARCPPRHQGRAVGQERQSPRHPQPGGISVTDREPATACPPGGAVPVHHLHGAAAAVAFSIIVGAPFAGGALPLEVLLALVACLFVASSIGQLAKHLPSAGGLAAYAIRGLHPAAALMVAWLYSLVEANVGLAAAKRAAAKRAAAKRSAYAG
jgi:Amino acid permease